MRLTLELFDSSCDIFPFIFSDGMTNCRKLLKFGRISVQTLSIFITATSIREYFTSAGSNARPQNSTRPPEWVKMWPGPWLGMSTSRELSMTCGIVTLTNCSRVELATFRWENSQIWLFYRKYFTFKMKWYPNDTIQFLTDKIGDF